MTTWTDFVKSFAKAKNISYGCALSDPACSSDYKKKYGDKKPLGKKKETELMGMEDIDAKPSKKSVEFKKAKASMKQKLNKKQVQNQLLETTGMMAEDINRIPLQDIAGNFVEVQPPKKSKGGRKKGSKNKPKGGVPTNITMVIEEVVQPKGRGRPKKYATAEEARKAKIANTIAGAKRRKIKRGGALIDMVSLTFNHAQQRWNRSNQFQRDKDFENSVFNEFFTEVVPTLLDRYDDDEIELTQEELDAEEVVRDYYDWVANLEVLVPPQQGQGLFSTFNKIGKIAKKVFKRTNPIQSAVVSAVSNIVRNPKAVISGRDDYPPKVRKIISKYGNKNITGITLARTPLGTPLMTALQIASGNTFSQKLSNTPYDKLFHLFVCIDFADDSKITLEKNEVINSEEGCKLPKDTETKSTTSSDIPTALTLNDALEKTRERMGKNFFTYSAKDNNCQDFIIAFLKANNIGNETDTSWVKQETKVLFEGNDRLRKIANTLTDIGSRVNVITEGAGMKKKKGGMIEEEDIIFEPDTPAYRRIDVLREQIQDSRAEIRIIKRETGLEDTPRQIELINFIKDNERKIQTLEKISPDISVLNYLKKRERGGKGLVKKSSNSIRMAKKKGGMADAGYESPLPTLRLTQEQGDLIRTTILQNIPIEEIQPMLMNILTSIQGIPDIRESFRNYLRGFNHPQQVNELMRRYDTIISFGSVASVLYFEGRGIKSKKGMPNKWITYVKDYAKKNNMKYNDALKHPDVKAGYKSGKGVGGVHKMPDGTMMLDSDMEKPVFTTMPIKPFRPKIGMGMPSSRDAYIAELYDQANLGANGRVNL